MAQTTYCMSGIIKGTGARFVNQKYLKYLSSLADVMLDRDIQ